MTTFRNGTYGALVVGNQFGQPNEYGLSYEIKIRPDGSPDGTIRTVFLPLMDKDGARATTQKGDDACEKSLRILAHLGFAGGIADMAKLDPEHPSFHSFAGRRCEVNCDHYKDKEKWYINIPREYKPIGGDLIEKLDSLCGSALREMTPAENNPDLPQQMPSESQASPAEQLFSAPAETSQPSVPPAANLDPPTPEDEKAADDIPF